MKLLYSLVICVFFVANSQAQLRLSVEIVLTVSGVHAQSSITYTLDAIETVWAGDDITTSYDQPQEVIVGNLDSTFATKGWDIYWDIDLHEAYAHGLYKLSTTNDDGFIYIDFRDSKYANPEYGGGGSYSADIFIHYFGNTDEFGIKDPSSGRYLKKDNHSLNRIWDIKNNGTAPLTTTFEDFWDYCLGMTYNSNENPRIVWGPHPTFSPISGYKIYRATIDWDGDPPSSGDYSLRATVNSSTFSFVDYDVKLDELGYHITYYYAKAYFEHPKTHNITYSTATNIVHTDYVDFYKSIGHQNTTIYNKSIKLHQNYPNPFNPTTTILFDLPKESTINLQIYDIQGKVVSTLVNETIDGGTHSVRFNSSGLPSGVYFYRLQTEVFTEIKRMLLLK